MMGDHNRPGPFALMSIAPSAYPTYGWLKVPQIDPSSTISLGLIIVSLLLA